MLHECEEGLRKNGEVGGIASPRLKIGSLYSLTIGTIPELLIKLKLRKSAFNDLFARAGFVPRIAVHVGDIFSLINFVSGGVGYSLLPGRVAAFSPRIQLIPLARRYAAKQAVTLLYPRKRERDPNLLALAAECRMLRRGLRQTQAQANQQ